jgi:uncharacterized protein (DUF433 family)/DNA-binding transcriptional MerR regulator
MTYEPKMAAALSGATLRQLAHWRNASATGGAILVPEVSSERPLLYSFRDIMALRTCVKLRKYSSLQKIRKALSQLREGLGETEHLSEYRLVSDQSTIYFVESEQAVDLVKQRGNLVIHQFIEVLDTYYHDGRQIPALLTPRKNLSIDPEVRGGEPVIAGTRIPSGEVAALLRDGISPANITRFYPGVSAAAARDAQDFADYVDSYQPRVSEAA